MVFAGAAPSTAETLRIATYNTDLTRKGPGLLLRDVLTGKDRQVEAAADVIAGVAPDVILLTGLDYDRDLVALGAFSERLSIRGQTYPHAFALRPNTGWATGIDLDGDGRLGGPGDAQGFGRFAGEGGMAILSRLPLDTDAVTDYSSFLWRDLPGALIDGAGLSDEAAAVQRLSSTGHWAVPVQLPSGQSLTLLAWHATPPVFDGPEDRNGRRNHDEAAFWLRLLDNQLPFRAPNAAFVILGDANLDPIDGDGRPNALTALLDDPRLQNPQPSSEGGADAAEAQGGVNNDHKGDPAQDTADWPEDRGPGNLRVEFVLPSADLQITDAGVWWPVLGSEAAKTAETASRHRLVWIDVALP